MEEDDATDGGGGAGGSGGGVLEDWPNDDEEENEPRHPHGADKAGASSSAAPTAPGGAPKRRADSLLFSSRPKKPKNPAAATKWREAAAKAAQFQKAPKQPPMVSSAAAALQQRLGEVQAELRTKEEECSKAAQECDRLVKELADQADRHKAELQKLKDVFFPGHAVTASQAIEARRDERRRAGAQIAPSAPRTLSEQLLPSQPAHRMLRRMQRVGAQEASEELVAARPALTQRAAAIAEYTNTGVFIPELDEEGAEVPPNWFGLNPVGGEDSAEEITSNEEGDDKEGEDGEDDAPEGGADGQLQPDRASSNELRVSAPTATDADQAETRQVATPPAGAANSTNLSDPSAAPLA
nr:uncharacterized protein LOC109740958 [Aegilops tauschii subsp. strangulata]